MVQSSNIIAYQVIIFTPRHSISGEIALREKRLSDHINERGDSSLFLRNVSISRLEEPGMILHKLVNAVVPKHGIVLLFEPPQLVAPPSQRFYSYVETVKTDVFLVVDRMEVRGILHTKGSVDVRRYLATLPDTFLPITQANVLFGASYKLLLTQDTILVNSQHIRFLGQSQTDSTTTAASSQPIVP